MRGYIIWKGENGAELLIEILNECDLPKVQKNFLEQKYIIISVDYAFNHVFMKVVKEDE